MPMYGEEAGKLLGIFVPQAIYNSVSQVGQRESKTLQMVKKKTYCLLWTTGDVYGRTDQYYSDWGWWGKHLGAGCDEV
jgi:hypothetical protein